MMGSYREESEAFFLLFDYGGVLGDDHLEHEEGLLAEKLGITRDEMNSYLSEKSEMGRAFREDKVSEVDFWAGINKSEHLLDVAEYAQMWFGTYSTNQEFVQFLCQLSNDYPIGILTNIDRGRSRLLWRQLKGFIQERHYFPSYAYGSSKGGSVLWKMVDTALRDLYGDIRVVYVDDREEHVASARLVGWEGIHFQEFELLKHSLADMGIRTDESVSKG